MTLHGSIYPSLVSKGVAQAARIGAGRWERAVRHVEGEQRRILAAILANAEKTAFGKAHGLDRVRRYEDLASSVPVGDYDSFAPYIERMRAGERNVLLPGLVRYFGNSSGSSDAGRSKFLPISERQIVETRRAGGDALMRYLAWSGDRDFLRGFTLGLFHPTNITPEGPVIRTTNPVLMVAKQPVFSRAVYLPDAACNDIEDYDAKMTAIADRYLDWDVRALTGTTCWFPVFFERVLEVAERRNRSARSIADIWPNLRVLFGGGVAAAPYMPMIRRLCGNPDITLVDTYNATEGGIYAASDHSGLPGMLMMPHRGTFFELVPLEEHGRPHASAVPLWAVEKDRQYVIVVTTCSGLYRYVLGDIVRFTAVDPPRVEFVGRLSGCLSITQELATHIDIEQAVAAACAECACTTVEFAAAAEIGIGTTTKSRYVVFVEFPPNGQPNLEAFAAAFDRGMCKANRVYGEHRGVALASPTVVPLIEGGAGRFMRELTRENMQGKFPRILDEQRKAKVMAYAVAN